MGKGFDPLTTIKIICSLNDIDLEEEIEIIEKEHKALEIIKEIDKTSLLHFIAVSVKGKDKYEFLKEELEK